MYVLHLQSCHRFTQAVLKLPPNKPLHADERALLWRFRFSVTSESRALTKFLKCVDWSDVVEGKQVGLSLPSRKRFSLLDASLHHCTVCLVMPSMPCEPCLLLLLIGNTQEVRISVLYFRF